MTINTLVNLVAQLRSQQMDRSPVATELDGWISAYRAAAQRADELAKMDGDGPLGSPIDHSFMILEAAILSGSDSDRQLREIESTLQVNYHPVHGRCCDGITVSRDGLTVLDYMLNVIAAYREKIDYLKSPPPPDPDRR